MPRRRAGRSERYATLGFFGALFTVIGAVEPGSFLTRDNLVLVLGQNAYLAFAACAVTLTLVAGQFDLSVGALVGLAALLTAGLTANQGLSPGLAVVLVLSAGAAAGIGNGLLVAGLGVNAFIATLGTGSAISGLALLYSDGQSIYSGIPQSLLDAGNRDVVGLPITFVYAMLLMAVLWIVTTHTVTGRNWSALGSNPDAARLAGVPTARSTVLAFVATSVVAAAGGAVLAARFGSADPGTGGDLLLPAFAAAFLGSTILSDGRFRIVGTVIATFLLAFATNGLELLGIGAFVKPIFNGAVLIGAVALTGALRRRTFAHLSR